MATSEIESILSHCALNEPVSESAFRSLEQAIGFPLPETYRALMRRSNGIEGFVNRAHYIVLWRVEQVVELNDAYHVSEFAPGLLLFGSNGGDEGFAFDLRNQGFSVVEVPFIGMSLNEVSQKGRSFDEFLLHLLNN